MKNLFAVLFLAYSAALFSQTQVKKDSIPAISVKIAGADYRDFVTVGKTVYAVTTIGILIVFDIEKEKIKETIPNVACVAKTKKGEIYYIANGKLMAVDNSGNKKEIASIPKINAISQLLLDKNDEYAILTDKGIYYKGAFHVPAERNRIYRPAYKSEDQKTNVFELPSLAFLDKKQRIWLNYDNGEFGTYNWFFDLEKNEFFEDRLDLLYNGIKGISENNAGEMLISESLMHFMVSGGLYILKETESPTFYSSVDLKEILDYKTVKNKLGESKYLNEYIGTTAFNPYDNWFYYYSDKGFFRILKTGKGYEKKFLFRPWITWKAGLPNAVGYQMNVVKFEFLSAQELVFLTSNNGIGYFDGKMIKYFQ